MNETTPDINCCCICSERNEPIDKSIGALIEVLSICVPEVTWQAEWHICKLCEAQITIITHFRKRCLHSNHILKQHNQAANYQKPDQVEGNRNDLSFTLNEPNSNRSRLNENVDNSINNRLAADNSCLINNSDNLDNDKFDLSHHNVCTICDKRFKTKKSLSIHVMKTHEDGLVEDVSLVDTLSVSIKQELIDTDLNETDSYMDSEFVDVKSEDHRNLIGDEMQSESESESGEIEEAANKRTLDLLPPKTRHHYDRVYSRFIDWCKIKNIEGGHYSENIFLEYFEEKSKIWKASSLWSTYSMIKLLLNVKNHQDIRKFKRLTAFLKRKSKGYRPQQSKILTCTQINNFLNNAPDDKYLLIKVAAIIGIFGGCSREELCSLSIDNIEDFGGNALLINIPNSNKSNLSRTFHVIGALYLSIYRKYCALRTCDCTHQRFFVQFLNNKCTKQPVGIKTFGKMPKDIATFLKLPDSKLYTGHCFRRSATSLLESL